MGYFLDPEIASSQINFKGIQRIPATPVPHASEQQTAVDANR